MIYNVVVMINCNVRVRQVHLLRVFLFRVLESNFPGDSLSNSTDVRIPPLRIKSLLESNPLKSKLLMGGLGVCVIPVSVKNTFLLWQSLLSSPSAETAIQPLIRCSESLSS